MNGGILIDLLLIFLGTVVGLGVIADPVTGLMWGPIALYFVVIYGHYCPLSPHEMACIVRHGKPWSAESLPFAVERAGWRSKGLGTFNDVRQRDRRVKAVCVFAEINVHPRIMWWYILLRCPFPRARVLSPIFADPVMDVDGELTTNSDFGLIRGPVAGYWYGMLFWGEDFEPMETELIGGTDREHWIHRPRGGREITHG